MLMALEGGRRSRLNTVNVGLHYFNSYYNRTCTLSRLNLYVCCLRSGSMSEIKVPLKVFLTCYFLLYATTYLHL